jgi:hypothetical protein
MTDTGRLLVRTGPVCPALASVVNTGASAPAGSARYTFPSVAAAAARGLPPTARAPNTLTEAVAIATACDRPSAR